MSMQVYLDYAATTFTAPEVVTAMTPFFTESFGNPSSIYSFSERNRKAIAKARQQVADVIGASADEIFFTSGGTEADNWALKGAAWRGRSKGNHIITTKIEHHAVLHTAQFLQENGFDVTFLDVDDLSQVKLYADPTLRKEGHGYWWLNANPKIWSFSDIAVGEVQSYTLYNDNGNKRRVFQNFLDAKAGDMIIGYESSPVKQVVAICMVSAEQDGEKINFEKIEGLPSPIDYKTLKNCSELEEMEYFINPQGSLFKLSKDEYEFLIDMIRDENPLPKEEKREKYGKTDFLNEVYMTESRYDMLLSVLKTKKNIILQGAPGVGKTFAARRLAYSIIEEVDDSRVEFVQFHQNYSYEDFMMGYKPVNDGFELKYGIFYRFCQKAANQPDKDFFFIIDEINRGNLSKVFGELLMLIEPDYRGTRITLAYNGLSFMVPKNIYIIGLMNTADRSLAMIDYALRRRFSFFEIEPGFDSDGFVKYQNSLNNETFNDLIKQVQELNKEISRDKSLGKGFCIGHSYFCGQVSCSDDWMHSIVDYDILPVLSEYWFDDSGKLQHWENIFAWRIL
jgi:5-methylcytosine-specific restriction protein B